MGRATFSFFRKPVGGYLSAVIGIIAITAVCFPLHQQFADTTAALAMLLVVLLVATGWGSAPALVASVAGMLSFNYFFLPPTPGTLTIEEPENWIALAAFFITALTAGQLSACARQRAAALGAERKRLLDVLDVLPAYVILLSQDHHVSFANRFFRERFGESHGRRCFEYLFGRDKPCEVCETYKALETRTAGQWNWLGPDGRNYDIFDFPFTDCDGSARILEMGLDVTDRNRAEAEIRRISRTNRALSRCNEVLIRATDESTLLQRICKIIIDEAGYRLCWVGRASQDDARSILPMAQAGFEQGYLDTLHLTWDDTERGRGPTGTCIRTGQTVLAKQIATDPRMIPWRAEALKRGYASAVAIPLFADSEVFGALSIYASETDSFGVEEVKLLTELADDLAFGIVALRIKAEHAKAEAEIRQLNAGLEQRVQERTAELRAANAALERAREREFEIGFRIQQTLLLDLPPINIPGLQIAALSLPSQRIDGDFYAFFEHQDQSLDIMVGDVMGKGIPAALLGAATKTQFLTALSQLLAVRPSGALPQPDEIVMRAHSEIVRQLIDLDSFVTLCYARVDMHLRRVLLVDCGHTGTIQWHAQTGQCEVLRGDNLPLGVRQDEIYTQFSVPFEAGDLFFFYSDGITEARNPAGEVFGVDRLQECVRAGGELEPEVLIETVRRAVALFSGSSRFVDDLTSLAVRTTAHSEIEIRSDPAELRRAREFVRGICRDAPGPPLEPDSISALELAVHEAAVNIMKHAYHGRADQWIHVDGEAFPGHVSIQLHHLGDSFDPSAVPPPAFDGSRDSGFGTYIISRSVDEVRYFRDQRGGSCVELVKNHNS